MIDRTLAVSVAGCGTTTVAGEFFRHVSLNVDDPLSGSSYGGRWGPEGTFPVLYLGRPLEAVVGEAYRHLVDPTEGMTGARVRPRSPSSAARSSSQRSLIFGIRATWSWSGFPNPISSLRSANTPDASASRKQRTNSVSAESSPRQPPDSAKPSRCSIITCLRRSGPSSWNPSFGSTYQQILASRSSALTRPRTSCEAQAGCSCLQPFDGRLVAEGAEWSLLIVEVEPAWELGLVPLSCCRWRRRPSRRAWCG